MKYLRIWLADRLVEFAILLTHMAEALNPEVFEVVDTIQPAPEPVPSSPERKPQPPGRDGSGGRDGRD